MGNEGERRSSPRVGQEVHKRRVNAVPTENNSVVHPEPVILVSTILSLKEHAPRAYLSPQEQFVYNTRVTQGVLPSDIATVLGLPTEEVRLLEATAFQKLEDVRSDPLIARIRAEIVEDLVSREIEERMSVIVEEGHIRLSPNERRILEPMYREGKSYPEIAEELDITVNAVKMRKTRAIRKIKDSEFVKERAAAIATEFPIAKLKELLPLLPEDQQRILVELYGDDQQGKEIAANEFVSISAISEKKTAALSRLRSLARNPQDEQRIRKGLPLTQEELTLFIQLGFDMLLSRQQFKVLRRSILEGHSQSAVTSAMKISAKTHTTLFTTAQRVVTEVIRDPKRIRIEEALIGITPQTVLKDLRLLDQEHVSQLSSLADIDEQARAILFASLNSIPQESLAHTHGITARHVRNILISTAEHIIRFAVERTIDRPTRYRLRAGMLVYDKQHGIVLSGPFTPEDPVELTNPEKIIFDALLAQEGKVTTFQSLEKQLSGGDEETDVTNAAKNRLRVYISRARKKLKQPKNERDKHQMIIASQRGQGYYIPMETGKKSLYLLEDSLTE